MNWAQRLKRVFGIDIEACARCGGKLKVIASIEESEVIAKILAHLERTAPDPHQSYLNNEVEQDHRAIKQQYSVHSGANGRTCSLKDSWIAALAGSAVPQGSGGEQSSPTHQNFVNRFGYGTGHITGQKCPEIW